MIDRDLSGEVARHLAAPLHRRFVSRRRDRALARAAARLLPAEGLTGLDVGCGTGLVACLTPGAQFEGCDVLVRPQTYIPVTEFNGRTLPYPDDSFDFAMFVDVLHHVDDPLGLLLEARRVSRRFVLIKDHYCENLWNHLVLRFMDWVGNRAHGVSLPYRYLGRARWRRLFQEAGLVPAALDERLGLYPRPFSWLFESGLHFMVRLER